MILSAGEAVRIRRLLNEIDTEIRGRNRPAYIHNRTRNIRLMLNRADRREKNTLL